MQYLRTIERLSRIHETILKERTGTPDEFARRLNISRRQLYYILDELKGFGASIKHDRTRRTFYYSGDFNLTITKLHYSTNSKKNKKTKETKSEGQD